MTRSLIRNSVLLVLFPSVSLVGEALCTSGVVTGTSVKKCVAGDWSFSSDFPLELSDHDLNENGALTDLKGLRTGGLYPDPKPV